MFNTGPDFGESIGQYRGDPLYHASLSAAEYSVLLDGLGFDVIAHVVEDRVNAGDRTVWLGRRR